MIEKSPTGQYQITLVGSLDENADLAGLFAKLDGPAIINMRHVERLNSLGVHRWIPIVTAFSAKHPLEIDEVSYAVVQNANVVANLFGTAFIRSCMAPYYCSRCNTNLTMTVTRDEVVSAGYMAPAKRCAECSTPMEFDELEGYFAFFSHRARR